MSRKLNFFTAILRPVGYAVAKLKFGYKYKKATDLPPNYIVLSNHVTDYDPILVGLSFQPQMYYVASEHITRWGWLYKVLNFVFEPIIRYKATVAASTVMDILRKVRKGNNVCIFAEGVRTWDGVTAPVVPATAQLVKSARCGLVTYRIEGGYFVSPNWASSGNTRRGRLYGAPVGIYTKEDLAKMSVEEIDEIIKRDLHEDAYARQKVEMHRYRSKKRAEGMESLVFLCPHCRENGTLTSEKERVTCSSCGKSFTYDEYGMLDGIPYKTVYELNQWQRGELKKDVENNVLYTAPNASLHTIEGHDLNTICEGDAHITPDAITIANVTIPLSTISDMGIHGRRTLIFSTTDNYYELKVPKGKNIIKFMYYREFVKAKTE
ncbi:MAG: 1-acyl-sn-glycerol-3-phosphate acyltransferase [Ruminococcaceae bacterium]|nr:1-acyl-sn-glycerol-3-phosphate acyltransferase [Oscillospiraceae bacterium]